MCYPLSCFCAVDVVSRHFFYLHFDREINKNTLTIFLTRTVYVFVFPIKYIAW